MKGSRRRPLGCCMLPGSAAACTHLSRLSFREIHAPLKGARARKIITTRETVFSELGVEASIDRLRGLLGWRDRNPFAVSDEPESLIEGDEMLGEGRLHESVKLLDGTAVSYGKGAIVGVAGEMEHGGACVHPMLGKPMRAAIGGGIR